MSVILSGVLRMPPEVWSDDPIDIMQRHSRYIQAADRIEQLEKLLKVFVSFEDGLSPSADWFVQQSKKVLTSRITCRKE